MNGLNNGAAFLNSPTWTISCILIVECVMLGLLINNHKLFLNSILPITIIVFYGIYANAESKGYREWVGFANLGTLQVWTSTCFGILAAHAAEKIRNKYKHHSLFLTTIEIICYFWSFYIMYSNGGSTMGATISFLIFIGISLSMSGKTYTSILFRANRFTTYLGEISFYIYLNHSLLLKMFSSYIDGKSMYKNRLILFLIVVTFAAVYGILMKLILKCFSILNIKMHNNKGFV